MAGQRKPHETSDSDGASTDDDAGIVSEGQRLLRAVDASLSTIADRVGVSKSLVGHWRTGHKAPAPEMRRVLSTLYGIPVGTWDVRVGRPVSERAEPTERAPMPAASSDNRAGTEAMLEVILKERGTQGLTVQEFTRLIDAEAKVRKLLHDLDQADALTETRIVTSPTMQKIRNAAIQSLERWPDALRAFIAALEGRA